MQDCRFAQARLQEKRGPEIRDEGPGQLDHSPALEPVKTFLLLRVSDKQGDICWLWSDGTIRRRRRASATAVKGASTTPDAISIAGTACGNASAAYWVSFVTFDLAGPKIT